MKPTKAQVRVLQRLAEQGQALIWYGSRSYYDPGHYAFFVGGGTVNSRLVAALMNAGWIARPQARYILTESGRAALQAASVKEKQA